MELQLLGVSATVDPPNPVVPKNIASAVRVLVRAGGQELTAADVARFVGAGFEVQAELSGPGLRETVSLPQRLPGDPPPADPLLLTFPALSVAGDYSLTNIRIVAGARPVLDVSPSKVTIQVIDQILVTSVKTRPLTLDEIKEKGIVLDSSSYLGFEFTLGLKLESKAVNFTFPVVFDRNGVAVPQPVLPPPPPPRGSVQLPSVPSPTILPVLLEAFEGDGPNRRKVPLTTDKGEPIRIPSVIVIPGNVGYLRQFFSAQLFVANGAPVGSGLTVKGITGTINLPPGKDKELGTDDDPLSLPDTVNGPQLPTLPVKGIGPDGTPSVESFKPGEQGQAEFLIRGDQEGFHTIGFDIAATLEGLPVGPVGVTGKASGGVLVRNARFDMTFTVPSVVRKGEKFKLFATINNIGEGRANDVHVQIDAAAMSGAHLVCDPPTSDCSEQVVPGIAQHQAKTIAYTFESERTGQVVASYLHFEPKPGPGGVDASGNLRFTLGVGERGVPLSPDTLVLPSSVDELPAEIVDAAMRVLGQAWSIANAPVGTLPRGVVRTSKTVVTQKALALAEAGLRVSLRDAAPAERQQALQDAVRDIALDFFGGTPLDPGFDQLLRQTEAGRELVLAVGAALVEPMGLAGGPLAYEHDLAQLAASGPDFISFAVGQGMGGAPVDITLTDASGRRSLSGATAEAPPSDVPGAVMIPLGSPAGAPVLGVLTAPTAAPYTLELAGRGDGTLDLSFTLPRGDGTFLRVEATGRTVGPNSKTRVVIDLDQPDTLVLEEDVNGTGQFESHPLSGVVILPQGPQLLAAAVIGPETLAGASPFGLQMAVLFDRVVDPASAAEKTNYQIPANSVQAARSQLSGRLVFAALDEPEGPYIPTTLTVSGIADSHGAVGPTLTVPLQSRLEDPGAVVSGRVLTAEGEPVAGNQVVYANNVDFTCEFPVLGGLAAVRTGADGRWEFRYVRQDKCGMAWQMSTTDPGTGGVRSVSSFVRAAGEQIVLDIVLFGRGSVTGIVKQSGVAVPGAKVVAVSQTDPQIGGAGETDGDGRYLITGITVGPITVRAAKGLFLGLTTGRIDRAGTTAEVDVNLDSGGARVSGLVQKLEDGQLSPAASAVVVYYVVMNNQSTPVGVTEAALDGTYAFEGMPTGNFTITAALNTRDRASINGALGSQDLPGQDILIKIPSAGELATVKGTVKMPTGDPAAGAVVRVGNRGVLTDITGSFTLPGVTVRPNQLQTIDAATRDGLRHGSARFLANEPGQVVDGVVIVLSGLGSAEFTVVDPAGNALGGQDVALLSFCDDPCGCNAKKTDAEGKVLYEGLPVGSVSANVIRFAQGYVDAAVASASITHDGDKGTAELRLLGAGTVSGTVYDPDGRPAFGADVTLRSRFFKYDGVFTCGMVEDVSHQARTGTDGKFKFTNVNVGPVSVTASQAFFPTQVGARDVLVGDGKSVEFTLRLVSTISGVLSGTVFLPDGETPAGAGVEVTANGALPDVVVKTNAQGLYRFAKIFPEGNYSLTARDPITGGTVRDWVFLRARQDSTHDLRLKGRGTVRVRVVDGSDQPVTDAFVKLAESDFPNRRYEGAADASNQGVVTFDNVFEGPFSVEVRDTFARGGRASAVLAEPGASIDVKVRLSPAGTVLGHFLKRDRKTPIPYGTVRLVAGGRVIGQTTTLGAGDIGSFRFDYVPTGQIRLEAQDPLTARTGVALGSLDTDGQTLTLDLIAQGLGTVQGLVTQNDLPEASARVEIISGSFRASTFTDESGRYLVSGVPEGRVVVTASRGTGFLSGTNSDLLSGDGAVLTIDVAMRGSGAVSGRLVRPDGVTAGPPSLVTLQTGGAGGSTQKGTSQTDGRFAFASVPAGSATLRAEVLEGIDRTKTVTVDVPAGATLENVALTLNGVGQVTVVVRDANNNLVRNATVNITNPAIDAYSGISGVTDGNGRATFAEVWAGRLNVTATDPVTHLTGSNNTTDLPDQGAVTVPVSLEPAGRIEGVVLPAGTSTTGVAGVTVSGPGGQVTTNASGQFKFENVRLGDFYLSAATSDGDRGDFTGTLHFSGETAQATIRLNGLGTVHVQVGDPPVSDAEVTVSSSSRFGGFYRGKTQGDGGALTLFNVLAGDLTISGYDRSQGRGGQITVPLAPEQEISVVVPFDPVGTLKGHVLQPNGRDPFSGAVVSISGRSGVSQDDGSYEVVNLPLGTGSQTVKVSVDGQVRAEGSVVVTPSAPVVTRDWTLTGLGTVQGTVLDTLGLKAKGLIVKLAIWNGLRGTVEAKTDDQGAYSFSGVQVGPFSVWVSDASGNYARATGKIDFDGQTLTLEPLRLFDNAVDLPFQLWDGNRFTWQVGADASAGSALCFGSNPSSLFSGDCQRRGAPRLYLVRGGVEAAFVGQGNRAPAEEAKRQLVIRQDGLAGLNVTRKVFVPIDGYFARYLDTLQNPGPGPVTVDLVEEVNLAGNQGYEHVVATSSGDAAAGPEDRWVVLDDNKGTDYFDDTNQNPPVAVVMSGANGVPVSAVAWQSLFGSRFPARLTYRWNAIEVPAGETVSVLHFLSQQSDPVRAKASAERLSALPPEVFAGLSAAEARTVLNFPVPETLTSALIPLPPSDGTAVIRVVAGDGETRVPVSSVRFRSESQYLSRPLDASGTQDGAFIVRARVAGTFGSGDPAYWDLVPREAFTVKASYYDYLSASTKTAEATGSFPSSGVVDLTTMPGRRLQFSSRSSYVTTEWAVDADTQTVWRWADGDSAAPPYYREPFFEVGFPSQVTVHTIRFRGVRGPFFYYYPDPNPSKVRFEVRDASSMVIWSVVKDLPAPLRDVDLAVDPPVAGAYSVRVVDLADEAVSPGFSDFAILGEGVTQPTGRSEALIRFEGTGVVSGRALRSDSSGIANAQMSLSDGTHTAYVSADDAGGYRFVVVPAGDSYVVTAALPLVYSFTVSAPVSVVADQRTTQDLVFPPLGGLTGKVYRADGNTLASADLTLSGGSVSLSSRSWDYTGGLVDYSFSDVPAGSYTLRAVDTSSKGFVEQPVTIVGGSTQTLNITLPPVRNLSVTATSAGQPVQNGRVEWQSPTRGPDWIDAFTTDATGKRLIFSVPGPSFQVRVYYPGSKVLRSDPVPGSFVGEGADVPVAVDLPPLETLAGTVSGTVRHVDGSLAASAPIQVLTEDGTLAAETSTNAQGQYTSSVAPAGPIRVAVGAGYEAGSPPEERGFMTAGGSLTIDLIHAGVVRSAGDREVWTALLQAGTKVSVVLNPKVFGSITAMTQGAVEAYDPDGTLLATGLPTFFLGKWNGSVTSFTPSASGRYTLVARGMTTETGGFALYVSQQQNSRISYPRGAVTGAVTRRDTGAAFPNRRVRVSTGGARYVRNMLTDSQGGYSAGGVPPGDFTVEVLDADGVAVATDGGTIPPEGGTLTRDLVASPHGSVTATVWRGALKLSGIVVTLTSSDTGAPDSDRVRQRTTGANGSIAQTQMPVGQITAEAADPESGGAPFKDSDLLEEGQSLALNVHFPETNTTIHGTVTAGDGATLLEGATVELAPTGQTFTTGPDGVYRFEGLPPGTYTLTARFGSRSTTKPPVTTAGGDLTIDIVVPAPVLKGQVSEPNGAPVAGATVKACGYDAFFFNVCASSTTGPNGTYKIFPLPEWSVSSYYGYQYISVTATLNDGSNLQAYGFFYYYTSVGLFTSNITLPPTGTVKGTVRDGATVVAGASVSLSTIYGYQIQTGITDGNGNFSFPHVQPQGVRVYAESPGEAIPGANEGYVNAGQELTLDVDLVPTGTVSGVLKDGSNPMEGASLTVQALEAPRRVSYDPPWSRVVETGVDGTFAARVPVGPYRVVYPGESNGVSCQLQRPAAEEGLLAVNASDTVTLTRGNVVYLPQPLSGPLGNYVGGEDCDGNPSNVFDTVVGSTESYSLARREQDDRALRTLLVVGSGVRVRRQQFVPASGAFARTLTTITNPSLTQPVTLYLSSSLDLRTIDWKLVTTSSGDQSFDTADSYLVVSHEQANDVGVVFGGALAPSGVDFQPGYDSGEGLVPGRIATSHAVALEPGQTRTFLTFTVSRPPGEGALLTQVRALADLSDPEALAGLTDEERAAIVNFAAPAAPTGISGFVRLAGGTAVPGALVGVVRDGVVVARGVADSAGHFTLVGLEAGDQLAVAMDPATGRPGRLTVTVSEGSLTDVGDLTLLTDAETGTVKITGAIEGAGPAAGFSLDLSAADYGTFWKVTATLDGNGMATVFPVPPGTITARWGFPPDVQEASGVLSAGGQLELQMLFTATPAAVPVDLTGADQLPYFVDGNGSVQGGLEGCRTFCGSFAIVDGNSYPWTSEVLKRARETLTNPQDLSGVRVTRRAFVPPSGRFVRLLDVITNPSPDQPVFLSYSLQTDPQTDGGPWDVEATSSGDLAFDVSDKWLVLRDVGGVAPALALVASGPAASAAPDWVDLSLYGSYGYATTQWSQIQIMPSQTVILMQFIVQRAPGDTAAAKDQAVALTSLSDPEALTGLTAEEKAAILNFNVP